MKNNSSHKSEWEKELEDLSCWEVCCAGRPPDHPADETQYLQLTKFIKRLLSSQRQRIVEEAVRQLEMTILLREKMEMDGKMVDWPSDMRAFKNEYLEKLKKYEEKLIS